ncbi:MAG TPA: hypothetical protein VEY70_15825, partial [Metabacillus sp.]|nr:hypothetical protein [Metabacillus sp.]
KDEKAEKTTKEAGLDVVTDHFETWVEGEKGIFVSLIDSDEAKLARQQAIEKGMLLFTNLATFYACLEAITAADNEVSSIQEFLKPLVKNK